MRRRTRIGRLGDEKTPPPPFTPQTAEVLGLGMEGCEKPHPDWQAGGTKKRCHHLLRPQTAESAEVLRARDLRI